MKLKTILAIVLILGTVFTYADTVTIGEKTSTPKKTKIVPTKSGMWYLDFEAAKVVAKKEKKPILILFTGSDWCGACKVLDRDVFSKKEFQNYAKKNLILVKIDYLKKSEQSKELNEQRKKLTAKYQPTGYPNSFFVSSDETLIGKINGAKADYMKLMKDILAEKKKKGK